jgi:hypothetical protein
VHSTDARTAGDNAHSGVSFQMPTLAVVCACDECEIARQIHREAAKNSKILLGFFARSAQIYCAFGARKTLRAALSAWRLLGKSEWMQAGASPN